MLLLACTDPPLEIHAASTPDGIRVDLSRPASEIRLFDEAGQQRMRHTLPVPGAEVVLPVDLPPGRWRVAAEGASTWLIVEPPPALRVQVQLRTGGPWEDIQADMPVPMLAGSHAEIRVGLIRGIDGPLTVSLTGALTGPPDPTGEIPLPLPGQRVIRSLTLGEQPVTLRAAGVSGTLRPVVRTLAALQAEIGLGELSFPADQDGWPDAARPAWEIRLPSLFWEPIAERLGQRRGRQDREQPWAWLSVPVQSRGEAADLVLSVEIPDPAFRPKLREVGVETGAVSVLLRVPARSAAGGDRPVVAALPIFVERAAVAEGSYPVHLTVRAVGEDTPILEETRMLRVGRGDAVAGGGLLLAAASALAGAAWLWRRLPRLLAERSTRELMSIALFSSALFVIGGATDLLTVSVSALLGPFSTLLTGLVGDVGRIVLLGSLLGLIPRPGVLALCTLCGWLLRGLAMGGFSVVDAFYLGIAVSSGEGFAWIAGISRLPGWVEEGRGRRWLRLSVAFGGSALLTSLTGMWLHMALYRLFFAGWYIFLQSVVVGLGYAVLAAWIASRLVRSLRGVSP